MKLIKCNMSINIDLHQVFEYLNKHQYSFENIAVLNDFEKQLCIVGLSSNKKISVNSNDAFNWSEIETFLAEKDCYKFCMLSYDLKNEIENIKSNNIDLLNLPLVSCFIPELVLKFSLNSLETWSHPNTTINIDELLNEINEVEFNDSNLSPSNFTLKSSMTDEEYVEKFNKLLYHIQQGDIYEVNFCREFFLEDFEANPFELYQELSKISPMPFAGFYKDNDKFLLCASPERFFAKKADKIICQPIKGTIKRGTTEEEDLEFIQALSNSEKEQSENVMIVDLMRNDLSKIAEKNSVKVKELFRVYSFKQLHQMISTIEATVQNKTWEDIFKALYPMGSMTGTPKLRAMELIDEFENHKRSWYSGSLGYISPNGDADFNVVIRSLLINQTIRKANFSVGSAITSDANAEDELKECFLKAKAIMQLLNVEYKERILENV